MGRLVILLLPANSTDRCAGGHCAVSNSFPVRVTKSAAGLSQANSARDVHKRIANPLPLRQLAAWEGETENGMLSQGAWQLLTYRVGCTANALKLTGRLTLSVCNSKSVTGKLLKRDHDGPCHWTVGTQPLRLLIH